MLISEGYSSNLKTAFEEFFDKWVYLKDEVNVLPRIELQSAFEKCIWQAAIPVERYSEVADVYALTVLAKVLRKPDVAISWTERAGLPEEKRRVRSPACLVNLFHRFGCGLHVDSLR